MKLYVLGDSISIQYGPYLEQALRGTMAYARKEDEEEALLELDNPQGANGGDSAMVRTFLAAKAGAGGIDADILLLNCGLHDIKTDPQSLEKQVPLDRYRDNLLAIIDVVAGMGVRLIWVRTTPCNEEIHNHPEMAFHRYAADCAAYNHAADQTMAAADVPSIDLFRLTTNLGPDLYCDHVHFHEHVRAAQGAFIAGWLTGQTYRR